MKALDELALPKDRGYYHEHTWAKAEGDLVKIGITDYAQDMLGEITYLDLPEIEAEFAPGEQFGAIESAKSMSDLYMPVGGVVLNVNHELDEDPERINESPYQEGWIIEIKSSDPDELDALQTGAQYLEMLAGMERIE